MDPISTYASSGNFFFVDRTFATGSFIKYANLSGSSIDFDGDTNPDVDTEQVYKFISVTDGYVASVAAYDDPTRASKDDWVCYSQGVAGSGSANAQNVICVTRDKASTFRVGRTSNPSTSPYFRGKRTTFPEEGANANTISLNRPWGLAFDANGNLYISDYGNNRIVMVKKWWL